MASQIKWEKVLLDLGKVPGQGAEYESARRWQFQGVDCTAGIQAVCPVETQEDTPGPHKVVALKNRTLSSEVCILLEGIYES